MSVISITVHDYNLLPLFYCVYYGAHAYILFSLSQEYFM